MPGVRQGAPAGHGQLRFIPQGPVAPKKGSIAPTLDRAAHDFVARTTGEEIIDVVVGQEANLNQRIDFSDTNGDCFINVDNRHKVIDCGKGAGYVHLELEACVLVSCYFSPNRDIGEFESLLPTLGDFIRQTRGNKATRDDPQSTEPDSDIWGKAYQIVTKRLNLRNRSYPDEKTTNLQIEKLVLNLQLGKGVESIAYADDLGIIIRAKNAEILKRKAGCAVSKVTETLDSMGIKVAVEKTGSVLLAASRKITNIVLEVGGRAVATSDSVRYLGVTIDKNLKMRKHIKHTVEKANRMLALLYRLIPRVGGPRSNKRSTLASAVTRNNPHRSSGRVVQVHAHGRDYKSEARKTALEKWQERWSCYDGWAKTFIKDVREWTKRKFEEVDFLTTQTMTGHGCPRFQNIRLQFELGCGTKVSKSNIGDIILQGDARWKGTTDMLRAIMRIKTQEERRREKKSDHSTERQGQDRSHTPDVMPNGGFQGKGGKGLVGGGLWMKPQPDTRRALYIIA
ncbi:hypothetical protein D910_02093 [Dendroctonus ponderosae]|uniref:Reverse transcriptase domain-containing protein n=1 Tax=Dendroctonus ponderosae TaxID=77166 RepID=U4U221_DENPD|nr:hypothetical protein D910_02093 [Dendroctonus ponderosae]